MKKELIEELQKDLVAELMKKERTRLRPLMITEVERVLKNHEFMRTLRRKIRVELTAEMRDHFWSYLPVKVQKDLCKKAAYN